MASAVTRKAGSWLTTGLAVVAGTSCCWLPLLLLAVGAGSAAAAVGSFVSRYHIVFIAGAVILLGVAGWFVYFQGGTGEC